MCKSSFRCHERNPSNSLSLETFLLRSRVLRPCHKFPRNFCMENLSLAIIRVSVINAQLHEEIFRRTSAKQNPSSNERGRGGEGGREGDLLVHTNVHEMCFPAQDLSLWNSCRRKRRTPPWWKGSIVVEIGLDVENLGVTVLINEITRVRATITSRTILLEVQSFAIRPHRLLWRSSCFPLSHHHHLPAPPATYPLCLPLATR